MNVGRLFAAIVRRDLLVAFRRWGDVASPLMFFAIVSSLFPLALSPAPATLRAIGPAVHWVAALLSNLLALNGLYRADIEDGTMEQLLLRPEPLALVMLASFCTRAQQLMRMNLLVIKQPVLKESNWWESECALKYPHLGCSEWARCQYHEVRSGG